MHYLTKALTILLFACLLDGSNAMAGAKKAPAYSAEMKTPSDLCGRYGALSKIALSAEALPIPQRKHCLQKASQERREMRVRIQVIATVGPYGPSF
jgi:hypothetical protein